MRKLVTVALLLIVGIGLWAKGDTEADYVPVEGKENWSHTFDINEKEPGTYNIIIKGVDAAGNIAYEGPFNIYIDPESDRPGVSIANPVRWMRVGSSLNIVGSAIDDDAVGFVEIKIDDGEYVRVEGTDFWEWFLDVENIEDGKHTITARATDIKGNEGRELVVPFHLDKNLPAITVNNIGSGDLVSGDVKIQGQVVDLNGLKQLYVSEDGGMEYRPINSWFDQELNAYNFELDIRTREEADGPKILWFKAVDMLGSTGHLAFLLFIDNTAPEVVIAAPSQEGGLNGKNLFAGSVNDDISVQSLSYKTALMEEALPIEIIPGNPFWNTEIDLTGLSGDKTTITFITGDLAGNSQEYYFEQALDLEADKPLLELSSITAEGTYSGDLYLTGIARDDDDIKAMEYSLNGSEPQIIPIEEGFHVPLLNLKSGQNTLLIKAIDIFDTKGNQQEIPFIWKGAKPEIAFKTVSIGEGENAQALPFKGGVFLSSLNANTLSGTLKAQNELVSFTYDIDGNWQGQINVDKKSSEQTFNLPLPRDISYGVVPVTITATDVFEQTTSYTSFVYMENLNNVRDPHGIYFADPRADKLSATITADNPFEGYFLGDTIAEIKLEPATDLIKIVENNQRFIISATGNGTTDSTQIKIKTRRGHEFASGFFTFRADTAAPKISITSPAAGEWTKGTIEIGGTIAEAGTLGSLEYSVDGGGSYKPLTFGTADQGYNFKQNITLPGEDGIYTVKLRALDSAGQKHFAYLPVRKDSTAPEIVVHNTEADLNNNGAFIIAGAVNEAWDVTSVEFSVDGGDFKKVSGLNGNSLFTIPVNNKANRVQIRATDAAGNQGTSSVRLASSRAAEEAPKPVIRIISPLEGSFVESGTVTVVGIIENFTDTPTLNYRNGNDQSTLRLFGNGAYFSQTVSVSGAPGSTIKFSVNALYEKAKTETEDGIKEQASAQVSFKVGDNKANQSLLHFNHPVNGTVINEEPFISGGVQNSDYLAKVEYSINDSDFTELRLKNNTFLIPLSGVSYGNHEVVIRAIDNFGNPDKSITHTFSYAESKVPTRFTTVNTNKDASENHRIGTPVVVGQDVSLNGTIATDYKLSEIFYTMNDGEQQQLRTAKVENGYTFQIPLPAQLRKEKIVIDISGKDEKGGTIEASTFIYAVTNKSPEFVHDEEGLYVDLPGDSTRLDLSIGNSLGAFFVGRPIKNVSFEKDIDFLRLNWKEDDITLNVITEGISEKNRIIVTTVDGETFNSPLIDFFVDKTNPIITFSGPESGSWLKDNLQLAGQINESLGISSLSYSIDGGQTFFTIPYELSEQSNSIFTFDETIKLSGAEGAYSVTVKAEDHNGNIGTHNFLVHKDTISPMVVQVQPIPTRNINGITGITVQINDAGLIQEVSQSSDGENYEAVPGKFIYNYTLDFSSYGEEFPENFYVKAVDFSGNETIFTPIFEVNVEEDKPIVQIQTPPEGTVVRSDFVISGMVFDDDGINAVFYRMRPINLDGTVPETDAEFIRLPGENNFEVAVALDDIIDNEHIIEMRAEDIYGVQSDLFTSKFKVSKKEPVAAMYTPVIEVTNRETIELRGAAFDKNGIKEVYVSFDNGISFFKTELQEDEVYVDQYGEAMTTEYDDGYYRSEWTYVLNTQTLTDGTFSVMVKSIDKYDTVGLFTSLINIDNMAPDVTLVRPYDGELASEEIILDGRANDNINITELNFQLAPVNPETGETEPPVITGELPTDGVFKRSIDLTDIPPGWYNIQLDVYDKAGNKNHITRNIQKMESLAVDSLDILYPSDGADVSGTFTIDGRLIAKNEIESVVLLIDEQVVESIPVNKAGYFTALLDHTRLAGGEHTVQIQADLGDDEILSSLTNVITYQEQGPWIKVESHASGDYVTGRPYIKGVAGYTLLPVTGEDPESGEFKQKLWERRPVLVEVSLNNGKTFQEANGTDQWEYRLQTQNMRNGEYPIIIRAEYADGTKAVKRMNLTVDLVLPDIKMIGPYEGGRFNEEIFVFGSAGDNYDLRDITINLREGDKNSYEVPQFIQGLYLDTHFWGSSYTEVGLGLTFFDDNVKIQGQIGYVPEYRFSPNNTSLSVGIKLLANVAQLPFEYFFGPDWEIFSMSFAVGANFAYFTNQMTVGPTDDGVIIGAILAQWEFAKFTLPQRILFTSYAFYFETSFSFIASEVQATVEPRAAFGVRFGVF